ncbi:MAG: helix-turn-helix domain-containing protein [Egicoccus sp.]
MSATQELENPFGDRLREWRQRRRFSQLELSLAAEVSTRHLSFLETGRSKPSRDMVLTGHLPNPALAVDGQWNLVQANAAAMVLMEGVDPTLLGPPANVYRVSLHPDGLAGRVVNLDEVAHHLLSRLRHDVEVSGDQGLADLLAEVERYPTERLREMVGPG